MAIQPEIRPSGSSYRIRFTGLLVIGDDDPSTINGTFPRSVSTTPRPGDKITVRFALADVDNLDNTLRRLPPFCYDYDVPGTSPIKANDWAQNVMIQSKEGPSTASDPGKVVFSYIDTLTPAWELDTDTEGLRRNTKVPVLLLDFYCTGNPMPSSKLGEVPIILDIWFPPSSVR